MLRIYAIPVSLYCAKLRILLRHKGLTWEEVPPPGGYGSAEYRATVPAGNLPALMDGDLLLGDSEAIAEYLNEVQPEPEMLPATPAARAQIRALSRYHDTRLEPAVRALFPFIARSSRAGFDAARHGKALRDWLAGLALLLERMPRREALSLGDTGYPITLTWLGGLMPLLGLDVELPDPVVRYVGWLEKHDAVSAELADYRPKLEAWLQERVSG